MPLATYAEKYCLIGKRDSSTTCKILEMREC